MIASHKTLLYFVQFVFYMRGKNMKSVPLLVKSLHAFARKESKKAEKNKFTVYIPNLCAMIGVVGIVVFGAFILFSPIIWSDENGHFMIIFYIVFGAGVLSGVYLIIKAMRFRIVVDGERITVYPLLSKTYTFTFDDINTVVRQTKKRYEGHAERIIIRTKQGKKVIAENSFIAYFKLVDKIKGCVDSSKLTGFEV